MDTISSENGYTLTVIQDEKVALAGSIPIKDQANPYFIACLLIIMIIAAAVMFTLYMMKMKEYRTKLARLERVRPSELRDYSRNPIKLREQISSLEMDIAGSDVDRLFEDRQ